MSERADLLALCHGLGEPSRDLVIGAEGNVSVRVGAEHMLIKASGCSMTGMSDADLLLVDRPTVLSLLDGGPVTDEQTADVYRRSVVTDVAEPRMPSVEAILHAVVYAESDAAVVAHTHPVAVNAILCSSTPELLVGGSMFPDQIVVLGRRQLLVPYTDPGVPLARAVRDALRAFVDESGAAPKAIYLANHGLFALAGTTAEAMLITSMAVKVARILLGTLTAGGPAFLPGHHVDRIDRRPDEQYRRAALARDAEGNGHG
jgi:rhamnose utilization protein RhaD (predicted bifunctional aldolase and dehydrogenase)